MESVLGKLNPLIVMLTTVTVSGAAFAAEPRPHDSSPIQITQTPEGYLFEQNRERILFYQSKTKSLNGEVPRANYVHPLYDLDGHVLTEDFPKDHLHQRGIFWA